MRLRSKIAIMLAGSALALSPAAAYADDIGNTLDGSLDAVAESMPLTLGGGNGSTTLYVQPRNGDGKQGCNLTSSTALTVAVNSSNAAVATVSPSSVTFTSCSATATLTITPVGEGTSTISLTQTVNNTGGTFDVDPATFTVDVVPPPNTAPTVSITGVEPGVSYPKGSVPPVGCEVVDAEDGNSSFPATLSAVSGPYAADGIGDQTASCSYVDGGGLSAASSATYHIVDPTPPVISHLLSPAVPDGDNGWYRGDVSLDWTVDEPESPSSLQLTGCEDQVIAADQSAADYSCTATSAGGSAGPETVSVKRDSTAPTNVRFLGGPADGEKYFPNTVPAAPSCTADDALSLLESCAVSGYSTAVGTHTLRAVARDNAGNETAVYGSSYRVRTLTLAGFSSPVDMSGTVNTVKNGATVPLKFTVADEGVPQTSTAVVKGFSVQRTSCTTGATEDAIELTTTGSTSLRYDTAAGQFIQNWKTPATPGACYTVSMTTIDDSSLSARFRLR